MIPISIEDPYVTTYFFYARDGITWRVIFSIRWFHVFMYVFKFHVI